MVTSVEWFGWKLVFKQKGGDKKMESSVKALKDSDHKGKEKSKMYWKE